MEFGFEQEAFIFRADGVTIVTPDDIMKLRLLPRDQCGYLVEFRSLPFSDPLKVKYSLLEARERAFKDARLAGFVIKDLDECKLSAKVRRDWLRQTGKAAFNYAGRGNITGRLWNVGRRATAGFHVHFSNIININYTDNGQQRSVVKYGLLNIPLIIQQMDIIFADEIREARRKPGEYEMKRHGFEYRSLPASVDIDKLVQALNCLKGFV